MKKKLLAMLLSSAMLAGILTGCSSGTSEGTAASEPAGTSEAVETEQTAGTSEAGTAEEITFPLEETKNFSMLCVINGDTPMDQVDAFQYLNEQSNITFDVDSVPSEDAAEKEGLILASGDYPDVFIFPVFPKMTSISTVRKGYSCRWRITSDSMRPI